MSIRTLLENNRRWAEGIREREPGYFEALARQQAPDFLWIGCSDSRVPANTIVGLDPGQVFVHRNVANVVVHSDMNCMSVLQFAVEQLGVEHVIVCGHYGCGGVQAAMQDRQLGLIDNWLRHIKDVYSRNDGELSRIADGAARADRLCELNVAAQVRNVCHTTIVQNAWVRGRSLSVHGWIYGLKDGLIKDLEVSVGGQQDLDRIYHMGDG